MPVYDRPEAPEPTMPEALTRKLDLARNMLDAGKTVEAAVLLDELEGRLPGDAEYWFTLGRAQGALGRDAGAEAAFARAAQLRPEMHEAHLNLALSRVYQSKLREAIPSFVAARRLKPDSPGLDNTLLDILQSVLQQDSAGTADLLQLEPLGDRPLVSIIMPTQNRAGLLKDALASVARQTYRNWEAVVINDGGEDISGTIGTLPQDVAAKTTVLQQPAPSGQARARNRAIAASRGEVVTFLDDDDIYKPDHLEALVGGMQESGAGVAYTLAEKVNERLVDGERVEIQRNAIFQDLRYSRALLLVRNFIPLISWGIRRTCFEQCGVFDESLACLEDWDLLLRFSARHEFHRIEKVTTEVHIRLGTNDSVSTRIPALATSRLLYARNPGTGHEWIDLARELYLEALFPRSP